MKFFMNIPWKINYFMTCLKKKIQGDRNRLIHLSYFDWKWISRITSSALIFVALSGQQYQAATFLDVTELTNGGKLGTLGMIRKTNLQP